MHDLERTNVDFSNFGSLKSTETRRRRTATASRARFQQFQLVEEH
jgi:hypothetical protein